MAGIAWSWMGCSGRDLGVFCKAPAEVVHNSALTERILIVNIIKALLSQEKKVCKAVPHPHL